MYAARFHNFILPGTSNKPIRILACEVDPQLSLYAEEAYRRYQALGLQCVHEFLDDCDTYFMRNQYRIQDHRAGSSKPLASTIMGRGIGFMHFVTRVYTRQCDKARVERRHSMSNKEFLKSVRFAESGRDEYYALYKETREIKWLFDAHNNYDYALNLISTHTYTKSSEAAVDRLLRKKAQVIKEASRRCK